jgi:hypothetical protein
MSLSVKRGFESKNAEKKKGRNLEQKKRKSSVTEREVDQPQSMCHIYECVKSRCPEHFILEPLHLKRRRQLSSLKCR